MQSKHRYNTIVCKTENIGLVKDQLFECLTNTKYCPYRVAFGDSGFCTHPDRSQFAIDSSCRYPAASGH